MNVFFDCDYTILSSDQKLRRSTREVFRRLVEDDHRVFLWSGEGARWAVARDHDLERYLSGVFAKPLQDFNAGLKRLHIPVVPDFVIDDYPAIVRHFGGYLIPEFYFSKQDNDDEMETVHQVVTELAATGQASHPRWSPPTAPVAADECQS